MENEAIKAKNGYILIALFSYIYRDSLGRMTKKITISVPEGRAESIMCPHEYHRPKLMWTLGQQPGCLADTAEVANPELCYFLGFSEQHSPVVKNSESGTIQSAQSQLYHKPAVWPWVRYVTSLASSSVKVG